MAAIMDKNFTSEERTQLNLSKFMGVFGYKPISDLIDFHKEKINKSASIKKYRLVELVEIYKRHPTRKLSDELVVILEVLGLRQAKYIDPHAGRIITGSMLTCIQQLEKIHKEMLELPSNVIYKNKKNQYKFYKTKKIAMDNFYNYLRQWV